MRKWIIVLLVVLLTLQLAGCDSWMVGEYASVKPHEEYSDEQSRDSLEASGVADIQSILKEQIADGKESFVIYITELDHENLPTIMSAATLSVTQNDPIGAFAVEEIQYEIGTSTGRTAIAVNITYNRSRFEILRIKELKNMDEVLAVLTSALEDCDTNVVIQVENFEDIDIVQKIQDYVDTHPDTCMEMPQVSLSVYPQGGKVRVVEALYTYQNSRDVLRTMQNYVQPVFRAANLNVSGEEEESVKFSRMYAFLMERNDYQLETSITPAYSLLRHGVGDSKAFANVFAAMCRSAELECYVITGTHSGEPWSWNLICIDDVYYHLDLMKSNAEGKLVLKSDEDMNGYVWDYSAYPEAEIEKKVTQKQSTEKVEKSDEEEDVVVEETVPEEIPEETVDTETVPTEG